MILFEIGHDDADTAALALPAMDHNFPASFLGLADEIIGHIEKGTDIIFRLHRVMDIDSQVDNTLFKVAPRRRSQGYNVCDSCLF
jgi:hypothetical protein